MFTLRILRSLFFFLLVIAIGSYSTKAESSPNFKRIISLAPAITETLFALGLEENIVGVTNVCDYPPEATKKQSVGGMVNPSLETIVSLKPDIVLLARNGTRGTIFHKLKSLGINFYLYEASTISEVPRGIRSLGEVLGVEKRAEKLAFTIEHKLKKYSGILKERHLKALFIIWGSPLIVAGKGSLAGEALKLVGIKSIAEKTVAPYPRFSLEEVIVRNPDIIFVGLGQDDRFRLTEGLVGKLSSVKALKNDKLFYLSDKLYRPGPRIVEGVKELVDKVTKGNE